MTPYLGGCQPIRIWGCKMWDMSYRGFKKTLKSLEDCIDHMDDGDLSYIEHTARLDLIRACSEVAEYYGDEVGLNVHVVEN